MALKYVRSKKYGTAGFVGRADRPVLVDKETGIHLERAAILGSRLEGAAYGTLNTWDGCGASASIIHLIAFDRRGNQGALFRLVGRMMERMGPTHLGALFELAKWRIDPRGGLRHVATGALVTVREFRAVVNQSAAGVTPPSGEGYAKAKEWALAFVDFFSDPRGRAAQLDHACAWLASGHTALEMKVYRRFAFHVVEPSALDSMIAVPSAALPAHVDLAMALYHAFSVNAPSLAARYLDEVMDDAKTPAELLAGLVEKFRTSTYGNWQNRYFRTRTAARALSADHGWGWPTSELP